VAIAQAGARLATGDYELAMGGSFGEGDDYEIRNVYYSKGVFNAGTITNPEIDRLIDAMKLELGERTEEAVLANAAIIMEDYRRFIIVLTDVMSEARPGYTPDLAIKGQLA
jgi:hypothetical protein